MNADGYDFGGLVGLVISGAVIGGAVFGGGSPGRELVGWVDEASLSCPEIG